MADVPGFASDNAPKSIKKGADWQSPKGKASKGPLIGCTLLALCAVGGIILAVVCNLGGGDDEAYFVTVPVGEYDDPAWPVNPWVYDDSTLLADCFKTREGKPLASIWYNSQQENRLQSGLDAIAKGIIEPGPTGEPDKTAGRPLVIHVSALAVVRAGTVYLLPVKAKPGDPTTWIKIATLLDAVQSCPSKKKLLILDLSRPVADPYCGVLWNDVATVLHAMLEARSKSNDPLKYSVLTACAPTEIAVPADPAKCTAFALALAEGLGGAADIYNDGAKGNDEVTVAELARFVAIRVDRYAQKVRNVRQTPQFYAPAGPDADFVVARGKVKKREFPSARGGYPSELRSAWANRDTEARSGAANGYPFAFARLTGGIVRAEQTWLGSDRGDRANLELAKVNNFWQDQGPKSGRGDPAADKLVKARQSVGDWRLVVARTKLEAPTAEATTAFNAYVAARLAPKPMTEKSDKPDDTGPLRTAWLAKAKGNLPLAAWMVWEQARQHPKPKSSDLAVYADLMKELKDEGLTQTASEIVLLRWLGARNFWKEQRLADSSYPGAAIEQLLKVENEVGLALAAGPEGWDLVGAEFESAEADRRDGQKWLFAADRPETVEKAEAALKGAVGKFRSIRTTLDEWSKANRTLQESTAIVAATLPAALAWNVPKFADWEQAAAASTVLANQLKAARHQGRFERTTVAEALGTAETTAAKLTAAVGRAKAEQLLKENKPRADAKELVEWQAVVAAPFVPPDARKSIWDAIVADTAKFHQTARQADENDIDAQTPTAKLAAPPRGDDPERVAAANRARAALALFRLAGFAKADALKPKVERAGTLGTATEYEALGDEIRKVWIEDWPTQMAADLKAERWADAARLARATPSGAAILREPEPTGGRESVATAKLIAAYYAAAEAQFRADNDYRSRDDAGFYANVFLVVPK